MPKTKTTKKFEKNKLKDTLKRRKDYKSKQKLFSKRKRSHTEAEDDAESISDQDAPTTALENMTVDEFFQNGFEVPEPSKKKRKRGEKSKKSQPQIKQQNSDEDDDEIDNELDNDGDEDDLNKASGGVIDAEEHDEESDSEDNEDDHIQSLAKLAEKDPEFHKYLQENDADLLNFEEDDLEDLNDFSDEEMEEEEEDLSINPKTGSLSISTIEKWEKSMIELHSIRSTKEMVLAFRSAAHVNDNQDKDYKYTITNSDVYNKLLISSLKQIPTTIAFHLPLKELSNGKLQVTAENKKMKTIAPLLKSHFTSILHLLSNLSDLMTIRLTLSSLLSLLPYSLPFRKLVKDVVKRISAIWSDSTSDEATRISSFLILRKFMIIGDSGIKESVLKTIYQALIKGCRHTNVHTIDAINLMKNSAAELWGVDQSIGYTTGFGFIRQLAIHLRSTIVNKTKDSYKVVYNWQCVHSLDFWSRVLAQNCSILQQIEVKQSKSKKELPLQSLIYPVTQVTLGVMRLIPSAQYFPLRFQLFRSLLRISFSTNTYIPLSSTIYEVLISKEMKRSSKPSTIKPLDFLTSIRATKGFLGTRVYQDGIGDQVIELLSEFFITWCKSISFPELALPIVVMLKRWLKEVSKKGTGNKNIKLNTSISVLVQKIEANSTYIERKRVKVDFAPNNRSGVEQFLKEESWEETPLGAYVKGQRKLREEKQKLLEQTRKDESKKLNGHKVVNDDNEDDDEDEDVIEDDESNSE